jgi:hypothetical protein
MQFTDKQIEDYKKKHGKIYLFEADGKSCLLKKAGRNEQSLAMVSAITRDDSGKSSFDSVKFNESLQLSCWVDGDEEFKTNDDLFLGMADKLQVISKASEVSVKEL